jgi:hypothetical protein
MPIYELRNTDITKQKEFYLEIWFFQWSYELIENSNLVRENSGLITQRPNPPIIHKITR